MQAACYSFWNVTWTGFRLDYFQLLIKRTYNVGGLDVLLETFNLILEILGRDLVIFDNDIDLQFLNAIADRD